MVMRCFQSPDGDKPSKKNGWSRPLHPLQFLAWFFLTLFSLLYFGAMVPNFPPGTWQITVAFTNGVILVVHVIVHVISISVDPADAAVREKNYKGPLPTFDRKTHAHVIENQTCHLCQVKVAPRSKHCSVCNKCISNFDHHCKWLNNCVGGRNYKLFIACVTSALLGCLYIFISSLILIAAYFTEDSWFYISDSNVNFLSWTSTPASLIGSNFGSGAQLSSSAFATSLVPLTNITKTEPVFIVFIPVQGIAFLTTLIIIALLTLLAIGLLGHLLAFHIYLMCQGLSTYEYIVKKREIAASSGNKQSKCDGKLYPQDNIKENIFFQTCGQLITRKANQIAPLRQHNTEKKGKKEEWELQTSDIVDKNSSEYLPKAAITTTLENGNIVNADDDSFLEHCVGDVYIGSPLRRQQQHLETIYTRTKPKPRINIVPAEENEEKVVDDKSKQEVPTTVIQSPSGVPRQHQCPPTPLLSPIKEDEKLKEIGRLSWKSRSISEQSLNNFNDDDDEEEPELPYEINILTQTSLEDSWGPKECGSLSNLFFHAAQSTTHSESEKPQEGGDEDDGFEEVIIPSLPCQDIKDGDSSEVTSLRKHKDSFLDGDHWAFIPHVDGRLYKINAYNNSNSQIGAHLPELCPYSLTRCKSEDELMLNQRNSKLQRRFSENEQQWRLHDDLSFTYPANGHTMGKGGISALALLYIEESERKLESPDVTFSATKNSSQPEGISPNLIQHQECWVNDRKFRHKNQVL